MSETNQTTETTTADCGCGGTAQTSSQPTVMSRILNKVFVPEIEKTRRMDLCKACEHFNPTFVQCKICLCFLEAKTRLQGFHCALPDIGQEAKW
jgi:hypothetical protein